MQLGNQRACDRLEFSLAPNKSALPPRSISMASRGDFFPVRYWAEFSCDRLWSIAPHCIFVIGKFMLNGLRRVESAMRHSGTVGLLMSAAVANSTNLHEQGIVRHEPGQQSHGFSSRLPARRDRPDMAPAVDDEELAGPMRAC